MLAKVTNYSEEYAAYVRPIRAEIGQWVVWTHFIVIITLKLIWLMEGTYVEEGCDCDGNLIFKSLMFGSDNSDFIIDNFVEVNNVGSQFDIKVAFSISAWVKT